MIEEREEIGSLRAALIRHALLGQEEAVTRHGERIGIGLLITQARRLIRRGVEPSLLEAMVELVRSDEEAPAPDEPFSLQWLEEPARWSRLEGRAWKAVLA